MIKRCVSFIFQCQNTSANPWYNHFNFKIWVQSIVQYYTEIVENQMAYAINGNLGVQWPSIHIRYRTSISLQNRAEIAATIIDIRPRWIDLLQTKIRNAMEAEGLKRFISLVNWLILHIETSKHHCEMVLLKVLTAGGKLTSAISVKKSHSTTFSHLMTIVKPKLQIQTVKSEC